MLKKNYLIRMVVILVLATVFCTMSLAVASGTSSVKDNPVTVTQEQTENFAPKLLVLSIKKNNSVILLNDEPKNISPMVPLEIKDKLMVPVKEYVSILGGTVNWNKDTEKLLIEMYGSKLQVKADSKNAEFNGQKITLDTAPKFVKSRMYMSIRTLASTFGDTVEWYPDEEKVIVKHTLENDK